MMVASCGHGRRVDVAALPAQHLDLELERLDLLGLDLDQLHQVLPLAPLGGLLAPRGGPLGVEVALELLLPLEERGHRVERRRARLGGGLELELGLAQLSVQPLELPA